MRLTLPYPPSVNRYWRSNRGRVHISDEGKDYRVRVMWTVADLGIEDLPVLGRLRVKVTTHAPDARRRDLDNTCKGLLDAMEHAGVYDDDAQIDDLRIVRGSTSRTNPRVEVEINPL